MYFDYAFCDETPLSAVWADIEYWTGAHGGIDLTNTGFVWTDQPMFAGGSPYTFCLRAKIMWKGDTDILIFRKDFTFTITELASSGDGSFSVAMDGGYTSPTGGDSATLDTTSGVGITPPDVVAEIAGDGGDVPFGNAVSLTLSTASGAGYTVLPVVSSLSLTFADGTSYGVTNGLVTIQDGSVVDVFISYEIYQSHAGETGTFAGSYTWSYAPPARKLRSLLESDGNDNDQVFSTEITLAPLSGDEDEKAVEKALAARNNENSGATIHASVGIGVMGIAILLLS